MHCLQCIFIYRIFKREEKKKLPTVVPVPAKKIETREDLEIFLRENPRVLELINTMCAKAHQTGLNGWLQEHLIHQDLSGEDLSRTWERLG